MKNPPANAGDAVWSLGWEDSLGGGNGNWFQYSCLENPMGRGAWLAIVHRVAKSQTTVRLSTHTQIYMQIHADIIYFMICISWYTYWWELLFILYINPYYMDFSIFSPTELSIKKYQFHIIFIIISILICRFKFTAL